MNLPALLNIPAKFLIESRITKKVFTENATLSAAEKKLLRNNIDKIIWIAAVKPSNSNIAAYKTASELYDEIHYIHVSLNEKSRYKKAAELIQKVIPYPIFLWLSFQNEFCLNAAIKSINQNDTDKRTIDEYIFSNLWKLEDDNTIISDLFKSLQIESLSHRSLKDYYQDIILRIKTLNAAEIKGKFQILSFEESERDVATLKRLEEIEQEIISLRNQMKKETHFSQKVELNVNIKKLDNEKQKIIIDMN